MKNSARSAKEKSLDLFAVLCGLFLLISVLLPVKTEARVYSSVLRFHVVANSDSDEDQAIKEEVKDAVLSWTGEGLKACETVTQAQAYLEENAQVLTQKIRHFLLERGVQYGANVKIANEYHDAKTYDEITLPQGTYLSLRITLGEGAGHNFFCVLFPPICQNAAKDQSRSEVLLDYGFSNESLRVLQGNGKTAYRFFLYDLICGLLKGS